MNDAPTANDLESRLRELGARRYHNLHPFHRMLHNGQCTKAQVQAWALNRYYYQAMIPLKDASLIGRCEDEALRREWRKRLDDHDGDENRPGGIERWLKLTDGLGLDREAVTSTRLLLPATRFAVQAYVHYVRERSLLEAVASCLTELFSSQIITERMAGMLAHYDFITPEIMSYFDKRPPQAERDANFALEWVKQHARTRRTAPGCRRYARVQVRRAVVHAGCAALLVCVARADPARRLRAVCRRCLKPLPERPRLAPGVRLHFDSTRSAWVLLGPERVIEAEGPAHEILQRCDGTRTVGEIVDELAALYTADRAEIAADVNDMLVELATKRMLA